MSAVDAKLHGPCAGTGETSEPRQRVAGCWESGRGDERGTDTPPPLICPPPEARGGKIFPVTGRRGGVVFGRPNPCAAPASANETAPARAGAVVGSEGVAVIVQLAPLGAR